MLGGFLLGSWVADPHVAWAVTRPGDFGEAAAFAAEVAISCGLMLVALFSSNCWRTNRFTGLFCGLLIATYYTVEAPISGMSMNPARTLGSAAGAGSFEALWIYFSAPPLGMVLAAEMYLRLRGAAGVRCAKLHHQNGQRCIFRCGWASAQKVRWTPTTSPSSAPARLEEVAPNPAHNRRDTCLRMWNEPSEAKKEQGDDRLPYLHRCLPACQTHPLARRRA